MRAVPKGTAEAELLRGACSSLAGVVPDPAGGRVNRSGYIKRKARIRPRNQKRYQRNLERAYQGDEGRADFVKLLPCLVCARTPSENAHVTNGGMSRKGDADLNVPLCGDAINGHHREYDEGKRSFVAKYAVELGSLTMREWAARVETAWQEFKAQRTDLTPLSAIVPAVIATIMETSHAEADRGREAVTASRRDDEGGLGARGAQRPQGREGTRPSADLPARAGRDGRVVGAE